MTQARQHKSDLFQDDGAIPQRLSARPAGTRLLDGQQGLPRHDTRSQEPEVRHFRGIRGRKNGHREPGDEDVGLPRPGPASEH